ncbi:MAG: hypothetical protein QOJ57_1250, partial [Thermoleophilaceae bacterium]|nr:hypothetical protein [Thermoleophilaceae bacterium]
TGATWGEWFTAELVEGWESGDGAPVHFEVEKRHPAKEPVLLNCLDFVYGHALLRLFNATRHIDAGDDVILLIPSSLAPLVPDGVAEVWSVHEPLHRLRGWMLDLDSRVNAELDRLGRCTLSPAFPHPHPSTFALSRYTGGVEPSRPGDPSIAFVLREERFWGGSPEEQDGRVAECWSELAARFPSARGTVVGVGRPRDWPPGLEDTRAVRPDAERERRWLATLAGADLSVGVHGSNMLLPSGLAQATIELLPLGRYHNFAQATLITEADPVAAVLRHHTLHGDDDLADLPPARVAALATAVLASGPSLHTSMLGPYAGQETRPDEQPVREFIAVEPPADPPARDPLPRRAAATALALANQQRDRIAAKRAEAARAQKVDGIGAPVVLTDSRGHRFRLVDRGEVEQFLTLGGGTEAEEIEAARAYLAPGMTAFDVGGHIGKFAVVLGAAVGPRGQVHAFEPLPASYARLVENLALNGLDQVVTHRSAVSDRVGEEELVLYGEGRASWSSLVPRSIEREDWVVRPEETVTVPTTTIDEAALSLGIERIDLLKIDVEGAEAKVLAGASGLLERGAVDAVLIELSDETLVPAGTTAVAVVERLENLGLRTHECTPEGLVPFRALGPLERLVNVLAASPRAIERLREVDLLRPGRSR